MTEHLKLIKENAYLKLGIITLIEAIDNKRQLIPIKEFLKDLIDGVEGNVRKENAEKLRKFFDELEKGSNTNEENGFSLKTENEQLQQENTQLKDKVEKAIKYLYEHSEYNDEYGVHYIKEDEYCVDYLLDILKEKYEYKGKSE